MYKLLFFTKSMHSVPLSALFFRACPVLLLSISLALSSKDRRRIDESNDESNGLDADISRTVSPAPESQNRSLEDNRLVHFDYCWDDSDTNEQAQGDTLNLGILVDQGWYEENGNSDATVTSKVEHIVKYTSEIFSQQMDFTLRIAKLLLAKNDDSVPGFDFNARPKMLYTDPETGCDDHISIELRLAKFNLWRLNHYPDLFGVWILFTACHPAFMNYKESEMGIATTNTLCTPKSVAVVTSNEPVIFGHEVGHVVGAHHPCKHDHTLCNVEAGIMSPSSDLTGNYMGETQFAPLHQKHMCQGIRRARARESLSLVRECWVKLKQDFPEHKIGIHLPGGCGGIENPTCKSCQGIYDARLQESGRCTYDPKSRRCVPVIWAHQYDGFGEEKNCPDCRLDKPAEETCHCGETVSCALGETCEDPFVMAKTCSRPISGCMDKDAHNYNPEAVVDNGSCETCSDGIRNGDELQTDCGGKCNQDRCEWFIGASGESCKDTCWSLTFFVDYEKMGKMTEEQCHNILLAGTREVLGHLNPGEELLDGCFLYLSRENNQKWVNNLWYKSSDSSLISAHSKRRGCRRACPCTTERPERRNISSDMHKDHKCKATGVQRSHHYPWISSSSDCRETCEDAYDCLASQFSDKRFPGEHYGCVTYHGDGVEAKPVPENQTGVFSCTYNMV